MKEITDLKFTIRKYVVGKSGYELDTTLLLRRYYRQQNHYLVIFHQLFFYVHRSAVL